MIWHYVLISKLGHCSPCVERFGRWYPPLTPLQEPIAIDTLHMLTSFERSMPSLWTEGLSKKLSESFRKWLTERSASRRGSFLGARSAPRSAGYKSMNTSPSSTLMGYVFNF
jgi:hypothetical protein